MNPPPPPPPPLPLPLPQNPAPRVAACATTENHARNSVGGTQMRVLFRFSRTKINRSNRVLTSENFAADYSQLRLWGGGCKSSLKTTVCHKEHGKIKTKTPARRIKREEMKQGPTPGEPKQPRL